MPNLFTKRSDRTAPQAPDNHDIHVDVGEELSSLSAGENPKTVGKAVSEAETVVSAATIADIREIHVVRKGRCPKCGARIEELLATSICPMCGWYRQNHADTGSCLFSLTDGNTVRCDRFFRVENDQILCVRGDHVVCQLSRQFVQRIDYEWETELLARARENHQRTRAGVCSWCNITLEDLDEEGAPYEDYVAFGAYQQRFMFCSRKCMIAFRKQHPVRIHRNCYDTDCNECDQCIKRYDTQLFVRIRPSELLE